MRYLIRPADKHGGILMRLLSWLVVVAMLTIFVLISQRGLKTPARRATEAPAATATETATATASTGDVLRGGQLDVAATLNRIKSGERLSFRHDGSVFQNRERRLPQRSEGYYHEFVLPTPGENGPGARRIIQGQGGEYYLSVDHYDHFTRID
jgi:ribonuclease T1